jgi:putative redox protein
VHGRPFAVARSLQEMRTDSVEALRTRDARVLSERVEAFEPCGRAVNVRSRIVVATGTRGSFSTDSPRPAARPCCWPTEWPTGSNGDRRTEAHVPVPGQHGSREDVALLERGWYFHLIAPESQRMVKTTSSRIRYQAAVTNGRTETSADTVKEGVGGTAGFRPHELLEAALSSCMNITVRLKADELGLVLEAVRTEVSLDRSVSGRAVYKYSLQVDGLVTAEQRTILEEAASRCAVSQTLRREPSLVRVDM